MVLIEYYQEYTVKSKSGVEYKKHKKVYLDKEKVADFLIQKQQEEKRKKVLGLDHTIDKV